MTKLSDTQLIILNHAAQRGDLGVAAIDKRAVTKPAIEALLKAKLLKTLPRVAELALWARDDDGQPLALAITPKGLKAINMEAPEVAPVAEAAATTPRKAKAATAEKQAGKTAVAKTKSAPAPKCGTKLTSIIALMRRAKGATVQEMMKATDWQPHSVRGAISGAIKKKLGLEVISERVDETRTYRIAG